MSRPGGYSFTVAAPLGGEGPEAQVLWEHGCRGVMEAEGGVVGYFDEMIDLPLDGRWEELADDDSLERYYDELQAIELGDLVVAPTHTELALRGGQKVLWLDPGMAFGTGHHETTRMALAALVEHDLGGKSVLDVGCGSGILSIAADLLGAKLSLGLDIDPDAVRVSRENARLNRSRARFELSELTGERVPGADLSQVDVMVANLYAELHAQLADAYARHLVPGGRLLVTGILANRSEIVDDSLAAHFRVIEWRADGEWRLLIAERR